MQLDLSNALRQVEIIVFQSPTGTLADLRRLPISLPKQAFINMKKSYEEVVAPNLVNCTNLPPFVGDLRLSFPRNLYTFHMCTADSGNVPEIVAAGLYKNVVAVSGEVNWNMTFYVNVKTNLI